VKTKNLKTSTNLTIPIKQIDNIYDNNINNLKLKFLRYGLFDNPTNFLKNKNIAYMVYNDMKHPENMPI